MKAHDSWSSYRRTRTLRCFLCVAYFPACVATGLVSGALGYGPILMLSVAVGWLLFLAAVSLRSTFWPCPRCGEPFFTKTLWFEDPGRVSCVHCGQPKDSPPMVEPLRLSEPETPATRPSRYLAYPFTQRATVAGLLLWLASLKIGFGAAPTGLFFIPALICLAFACAAVLWLEPVQRFALQPGVTAEDVKPILVPAMGIALMFVVVGALAF